jgi:hypothetical protein
MSDAFYGSKFQCLSKELIIYFNNKIANVVINFICNLITNLKTFDVRAYFKSYKAVLLKNN